MRSSLTHHVCRQLGACHSLSAPIAALSLSSHASLRPVRRPHPVYRHPTRRTFLSKLFNKGPRDVTGPGTEPGYATFIEFHNRRHQGTKLPDRDELNAAFRTFFRHKVKHKRPVNQLEAAAVNLMLQHSSQREPDGPALLVEDLRLALSALRAKREGRQDGVAVVEFASMLYEQLRKHVSPDTWTENNDPDLYRLEELRSDDMLLYITVLTGHGASERAARIIAGFQDLTPRFALAEPNRLADLHLMVLLSMAKQQDPAMKEYAANLEAAGFRYDAGFHEALTTFCASDGQRNVDELQRWFEKPIADGAIARPGAYLALIKYSATAEHRPPWISKALQSLCDMNPPKAWWDVILQWAVYQDKDIDHIKHMINVMTQLNDHDESIRVDTSTINGLVAAALATKNMLLAERIYALTSELGLRPDAGTYALLLQARIAGHDTVGAASAFDEILHYGPLVPGSETEDVVNQYIRHLCSQDTDPRVIVRNLGRIERRAGDLGPDTVVAVCSHLLKNDRAADVIDTLSLHQQRLSVPERLMVQDSLHEYCLSKEASTARVWDCYNILRQFFAEMDKEARIRLMDGFFQRNRPDMATQVFGHMRALPVNEWRPDLETYVACFEGLGVHPDEDSLRMVHNMLKMDALIQPNTKLYNALMLAYTADEEPRTAYGFFEQITNSLEGPTYSSLEIVFHACRLLPDGYEKAKVIWDKMQKLEVEVPIDVFDAYIFMMAGQGRMEDIKSLLSTRTADYGEPTPTV